MVFVLGRYVMSFEKGGRMGLVGRYVGEVCGIRKRICRLLM